MLLQTDETVAELEALIKASSAQRLSSGQEARLAQLLAASPPRTSSLDALERDITRLRVEQFTREVEERHAKLTQANQRPVCAAIVFGCRYGSLMRSHVVCCAGKYGRGRHSN